MVKNNPAQLDVKIWSRPLRWGKLARHRFDARFNFGDSRVFYKLKLDKNALIERALEKQCRSGESYAEPGVAITAAGSDNRTHFQQYRRNDVSGDIKLGPDSTVKRNVLNR